jgi:hypothetical protein
MNALSRRQSFKVFLRGLLETAGSVVLASAVLPGKVAQAATAPEASAADLQQRANQLAGSRTQQPCAWVNGAFHNAFANGGFHNGTCGGSGGTFHNGGFANGTSGGGFHNGGFQNGGFANGAWHN